MLLGALVLTACGGGAGPAAVEAEADAADPPAGLGSPTAPPPTTATTAPPQPQAEPNPAPAPLPTPPWDLGPLPPDGLGPGARGEQVAKLEHRLVEFKYDVHTLDDLYDRDTESGGGGLPEGDGPRADGPRRPERRQRPRLLPAAAAARSRRRAASGRDRPPPAGAVPLHRRRPDTDPPRLHGVGEAVLPGRAVPHGEDATGFLPGRLPRHGLAEEPARTDVPALYYMVGIGVAIHGYHQVPPHPASHGCVRIPMFAAENLPSQVPDDTPVYVVDRVTPIGPAPPPGTKT